MKRILLALLLCSSFASAYAATFVSGVIAANTTWTKANSPYIVNGNLSVDSGYTLTIQPGVEVRIDSTRGIQVDGRIIAEGTPLDSIIFTSNSLNPLLSNWAGISFRIKARNDTSSFSFCRIEYANIGMYNAGTSLLVYKSVLRYHHTAAIYLTTPSMPTNCYNAVDRCLIAYNDNKGVWDSQNTPVPGSFTYNEVNYNSLGYYSQSSSNGMVVENNNFFYNDAGVSLEGGNVRGLRFNTFKGNAVMGLRVFGNNIYSAVSNNLFMYNRIGIWMTDVMVGNITNNTIAYNEDGIQHMQNSFNFPTPSNMSISNNCFKNNVKFNFRETSTIDYAALNNWWGDTAIAHIDSFIYDHYDSVALGTVSYQPILTSGAACQAVAPPPPCVATVLTEWKITSPGQATAKWTTVSGIREYEYSVRTITAPKPSGGIPTNFTQAMISGLAADTTYVVCVRSRCWQQPFYSEWSCDTLTVPNSIATSPAVPQLRIYPNPNNGVFTIDVPASMQAGTAVVMDVNGRIIQSKAYTAGSKLQFDMKDAAKGVYMVRLASDGTAMHATLVVN